MLTEPNWAAFSLAETVEQKEEAWKKSRYFIHAEIQNKETYKSFRNWVKKGSQKRMPSFAFPTPPL